LTTSWPATVCSARCCSAKPDVAEPAPEDLHEVGCVARLTKMVKFPDGTVRVLVEGLWRIRIKEFFSRPRRICARIRIACGRDEDSIELQAMLRNAHKQFEEIAKMSTGADRPGEDRRAEHRAPRPFRGPDRREPEPELEDRQKLLEMVSVRERLQKLLPMLNREQEVLT
jgi:ATP-dependent Lon protease